MAIGTTTVSVTPCCGDGLVAALFLNPLPTGSGPYTPTFTREQALLDRGICPDCKQSFRPWLRANGGQETPNGWRWDYSAAEWAYTAGGMR